MVEIKGAWERGQVDGSGYGYNTYNLRLIHPITIEPGQKLMIVNTSMVYAIAVYGLYGNSYKLITDGYISGYCTFTYDDWRCGYIPRIKVINPSAGRKTVLSDGDYIKMYIIDKEEEYINASLKTVANVSFNRRYTYMNPFLECERKDISQGGDFSDSTTRCIFKLPKHGSVEIRQQRYTGMFKVVRINGSTVEWLVQDWSYYSYRYDGDGESEYYAIVALSPNGTDSITIDSAKDKIAVYSYYDEGVRIQKSIHALYGKHIAFIGDSITQGRFRKSGDALNWTATKRFGDIIAEACNDMDYGNFGIGGALTSGNEWKSLLSNSNKINGYDVVFICGGTNDYGNDVNESTFKTAYRTIVDTLKANNTEVVACAPVYRTSRTAANSAGLYLYNFVDFIKTVSAEKDIKFIDLYSLTNNGIFIKTCPDGLHPNELGHRMMADFILDGYDRLVN